MTAKSIAYNDGDLRSAIHNQMIVRARDRGVSIVRKHLAHLIDPGLDRKAEDGADGLYDLFTNGLRRHPLAIQLDVDDQPVVPRISDMLKGNFSGVGVRPRKLDASLSDAEDTYDQAQHKNIICLGFVEGRSDILLITRSLEIETLDNIPILRFRLEDSWTWMFRLSEYAVTTQPNQ